MHRKTVLENGVKLLSEKIPHSRSVSLGIWIGVGSRDEHAEVSGVSHFIEHMVFKGTSRRSSLDIARELDAVGGLSNAFTSKENTCLHAKVLDRDFKRLADILSDLFLNSIFDEAEMDRERQVILQEISMVEDTPEDLIHLLLSEACWPDHPLGMSILGSGETVSSMDKDLLVDFFHRLYTPDRIIIAAAGNVDHQELEAFFRPLFEPLKNGGGIPTAQAPPVRAGVFCRERALEQVHVCLAGRGPSLSSEDRLAGALLNALLGGNMSSRLFQEIRERRGLAYSVYSFVSSYLDTGLLGIYLGTDPRWVNRALGVINREISRILEGDVPRDELEMMREYLTGGILLGAESGDNRMMRLAKNEYVFNRYISFDELIENLKKVEVDDIVRVAETCFKTGDVALVTLGPIDRDSLKEDFLLFH